MQMPFEEFRKFKSNLYFSPTDLVSSLPHYRFLESVLYTNYLSFFLNLKDISKYLKRFCRINQTYVQCRKNISDIQFDFELWCMLLQTMNTLVSNEHINQEVN